MRGHPRLAGALAAFLALTACSASGPSSGTATGAAAPGGGGSSAAPGGTPSGLAPSSAGAPRPATQPITKVLTVLLENEDATAAAARMPRLSAMGRAYGVATDYRAVTHPSLPNYLVMATGSTGGVTDDGPPSEHRVPGPSVFDVALAGGRTAAVYAEAMPSPCAQSSSGRYAVKHNPWAYVSSSGAPAACAAHDVPAGTVDSGALRDAVRNGTLPDVGYVVPDLCNDGHDCPLDVADGWLNRWWQLIQQGPDWQAGRLAVVVTFDEGKDGGDNRVFTVVAAPQLRGVTVGQPLTHRSWTRWMTDLVGAAPLPGTESAGSLGKAFGLTG